MIDNGSINHLVFFNKRLRIKFGYNFSIWHFVKICHDSRDINNKLLFMSLMTGKGKRKYYSTLFYIMEIFNWKQIISKHKLFFFLKGGQFLCHYSKRYLCFIHVTMVHEINVLNKLFRQILITIMKSNKQTTTTTFKKFNVENILHILHTNFF